MLMLEGERREVVSVGVHCISMTSGAVVVVVTDVVDAVVTVAADEANENLTLFLGLGDSVLEWGDVVVVVVV